MDELDLTDIFGRFGDLEKLAKESLPQAPQPKAVPAAQKAAPSSHSGSLSSGRTSRTTLGLGSPSSAQPTTRPARVEVKNEEPPRPTAGRFSQKAYEPALRDPEVMRAIMNLAEDTPTADAPRFSPAQVPALDAAPKAAQKISGRATRRSLPTVTILTSKSESDVEPT